MRVRLVPVLLALLAAVAASPAAAGGARSAPGASRERARPDLGRPHVVLLIVDTLRADMLGCYGRDGNPSPEIDRLAREGVRFAHAVAQCSWTRPSIGSLLTGRYPRSLGLYTEGNERLPAGALTLAELLAKGGWRTIGVTANPHLDAMFGFEQGFALWRDTSPLKLAFPGMPAPPDAVRVLGGVTLPAAPGLFDWILERTAGKGDAPWFVMADVMEVHPAGAPIREEFWRLYAGMRPGVRRYRQAVRQVSADIGRFVERFVHRPGFGNTLVVIASDHGHGLADHPGIRRGHLHGYLLYGTQLHVPLILWHSRGMLGSRVVERPVRNLDLVPTLLDLLGQPLPSNLDGVSLVPLLAGGDDAPGLPRVFVAETRFDGANKRAAWAPGWRYYRNLDHWPGTAPEELQRAGAPEIGAETSLLAEYPRIAARLRAFLDRWEREHPEAPPTPLAEDQVDQETIERLRSIGYTGAGAPARKPGGGR